jgi:hypothetical protein
MGTPASATAPCEHIWQLTETGYIRTWTTRLDATSQRIIAEYTGSEDFSDEGAGDEHLQCSLCLATTPLPPGWEIDYR